jgi:hypothetical protein
MKKEKKYIFVIITILIFFILICFIMKNENSINTEVGNTVNLENKIQSQNEIEISNIIDNSDNIEEIQENDKNIETKETNEIENIEESSSKNSSLPNDEGLTVYGIPKTFNQDIMSLANIAYLIGCEDITESTDLEEYINSNIPKDGIYISKRTAYKKTDNPYEYNKPSEIMMQEMLSKINLKYNIDENNYLINNNGNGELEQKLNKIISGNKKIIIGFVADYYTYINDTEYGLQLGGAFITSSYVSFKPYNGIYAYIFDENSANIDDFYTMIEEISALAD